MKNWVPVLLHLLGFLGLGCLLLLILELHDRESSERLLLDAEIVRTSERIRALTDSLFELQDNIDVLSRSPARDLEVRGLEENLDRLHDRFAVGMTYLEEQSTRIDALLGILQSLSRSRMTPDPAQEEFETLVKNAVDDETERRRASYMGQLRVLNSGAREQWIRGLSTRLGMSEDQAEEVIRIYDLQSEKWANLYYRAQTGELDPERMVSEYGMIRAETDRLLLRALGAELKDRFREAELDAFPPVRRPPAERPTEPK